MANLFQAWDNEAKTLGAAKATPEQIEARRQEVAKYVQAKAKEAGLSSKQTNNILSEFDAYSRRNSASTDDQMTPEERDMVKRTKEGTVGTGALLEAGRAIVDFGRGVGSSVPRVAADLSQAWSDVGDNDPTELSAHIAKKAYDASEDIQSGYSEGTKRRKQDFWTPTGVAMGVGENLGQIAVTAAGFALTGGAAAAAGLSKAAQLGTAAATGATLAYGQGYGQGKENALDEINKTSNKDLYANVVAEHAAWKEAGSKGEQPYLVKVYQESEGDLNKMKDLMAEHAGDYSGAFTAITSPLAMGVGSMMTKKLAQEAAKEGSRSVIAQNILRQTSAADVAELSRRIAANAGVAPQLAKVMGKQAAFQGGEEFLQEGGEGYFANKAGSQARGDKGTLNAQDWSSVLNQGAQGAAIGAIMGAGGSLLLARGHQGVEAPPASKLDTNALVSAINGAVAPLNQARDTLAGQVDALNAQVQAIDAASASGQLGAADIARKQALLQELAAKQTELSAVSAKAQDAAISASNDALKQYAQAGEVPDFNAMGERLGINPDDLSSLYDQHSTSIKQQQAATDTRNKVASLIEANDTEGAQAFLEQNGFKADQADVIMDDALQGIAIKKAKEAKLNVATKLRAERDSELASILKTKPDASFANDVLPILQKKYKLQSGSEALSVWNEAKKQSKAAPVDQQAPLPVADEQTPAVDNTQAIADELAQHIETKTRPDFIGLGKKYSAKPLDLDKQYREMLRVKKEQSKTVPPVAPVPNEAAPIVQPPPKQKAADRPIDPEKDSLLVALAKIGGLSRDEAISHGVDKAMLGHRPIFGKLLFRTDGKSFDSAAEALAQDNYPVFEDDQYNDAGLHGGNGRSHTGKALLLALTDALNGNDIGTPQYYVAKAQKAFEEEQEQARIDALFDGKGNSKADWLDDVSDAIVDELIENPSTATQEVIEVIQNDAGTEAQDVTGNSQAETQPTADETSPPVSSQEATSQSESGGREGDGSRQTDSESIVNKYKDFPVVAFHPTYGEIIEVPTTRGVNVRISRAEVERNISPTVNTFTKDGKLKEEKHVLGNTLIGDKVLTDAAQQTKDMKAAGWTVAQKPLTRIQEFKLMQDGYSSYVPDGEGGYHEVGNDGFVWAKPPQKTTTGQQIAEALDATATAIGAAAHQSAINRFKKEGVLTYFHPLAIAKAQEDSRYNVEINADGHAVVKGIKDGDTWLGIAPEAQTERKEAQEIGDAEFDARMKELGYQEQEEIIDHVTAKGKTIRGVVRKGITKEEAKLIDPYTFAKDGGFFIREKYLTQTEPVKTEAKQEQPQDKPVQNNAPTPVKQPETKALPPQDRLVGKNSEGKDLYEDSRGVRFFKQSGAKVFEGIAIGRNNSLGAIQREDEYRTVEEVAARQPKPQPKEEKPAPIKQPTKKESLLIQIDDELDSALDDLAAIFKEQGKRLSSGVDPVIMGKVLAIGIKASTLYLAKGAVKFSIWAENMIASLSSKGVAQDLVEPYLKGLYAASKMQVSPEIRKQMDKEDDVYDFDFATLNVDEQTKGKENELSQLDDTSTKPLEGVSANNVQGTGSERTTGSQIARSGRDDLSGNERTGGAGLSTTRVMGDGTGEVSDAARGKGTEQLAVTPAQDIATDFVIPEDDNIGGGGLKTKYRNNVAAIRVLKQVESEGREATNEEQKILAKWVGWGSLYQAFRYSDGSIAKGWDKEVKELAELLTPDEMKAAVDSSVAAHYTSPKIVEAIWKAVQQLGFKGGKVLEPSVGSGNFFGAMPTKLRNSALLHGVELDNITGGIAKLLYPKAKIKAAMGFQDYAIPNGHFDLAIGNPPFGNIKITDKTQRHLDGFTLHNYFFAKSIDALREGGVLAMVVTNRLMDASNANDKARQYIDEHAELLGAIRLPNNAFLKNAGTQVTTDIIFLRKRVAGEDITTNKWMNVRQYQDKNGKTVPLNEYFHAHPEMMLGEFGAYGSMYTPDDPALVARDGQNTLALLNDAITKLPKSVMPTVEQKSEEMAEKTAKDIPDVKVGSMFVEDGDIYIRQQDKLGERQADVITLIGKSADRVKGMINIRDAFILVRDAQLSPNKDSELPSLRKKLNVAYDAFVKTNGFINDDANKRLMRDDPSWPQLSALEEKYDKGLSAAVAKTTGEVARPVSASKAAIFNVRTQFPYATITSVSSAKDGYLESLNRYGKMDIDFVANLYGQSVNDTITELGNLVYQDPVRGWVTSSDYLSGNVKLKLQAAKLSLKAQESAKGELESLPPIEQLHRSIAALEAVIPADIESVDIDVRAGAHWLPPKHIADFAREILGINGSVGATYNKYDATWSVDFNQRNVSAAKQATWSTDRKSAAEILNAALNHKQSTVYDKHDDGTTTVNVEATAAANEKVTSLKRAWADWIWQDDNRRVELSRLYNDTFNTDAPTVFDGQHLTLAGKIDDDVLRLRPHQNDGIWRITQSDSTLLDHVVGAGKTFTMIGGAMELRRMGKSNKPMFVVPNHLVGQWAADFIKLYPSANILAATKADFEAKNRKKLFARIATGDWDAVIVAHSSFGKVSLHPDEEAKFIKKEISDMLEAEDLARKQGGEKARNVKDIAKRRLAKEDKLKKLLATKNKDDDNVYWNELGVDSLFVDEAHEFKNLAFTSTIQRVAGLGNQAGSQKATDLYTKINSLKDRVAGAKVVFATGTPISNTMAEMYTMQRYLDLERMTHQGTVLFDAWARTFGEVVSDWELSPAGKYKMNSRFAKFVNMPELMQGYLSFADVINRDDINRQLAARGETLGTPKIRTGKPQNIVVERSQAQADYIGEATTDSDGNESYPEGSLVYRAENIPKKQEKGADNMLKIMSDARKAALDMRLIDPSLSDSPTSKVNEAIRRILTIYHQWNADKGVQLVFCDLSTPKGAIAQEKARIEELVRLADEGDEAAIKELDEMSPDELDALNSSFSVYDDMKSKLIAQGIPANQVAFIHDAKTDIQKEALFGKVRSGQIRVLIGSTAKMGAGMNVQDKLVALHHLDAPWRPSDLEQREGRIIRQKNEFYKRDPNGFEVDIMRYATKQTLDSRMWQTLEGKARFIEQIRKGDIKSRSVEDIGGEAANAAEMKAASSGNPLILEEMTLRREVQNLEAEKQRHVREQHRLKGTTKKLQEDNEYLEQRVAKMEVDVKSKTPEEFEMTVGRKVFKQGEEKARERAGKALSDAAKDIYIKGESRVVGKFGDFDVVARLSLFGSTMFSVEAKSGLNYGEFSFDAENDSLSGLTLKIANAANSVEGLLDRAKATIGSNNKEIPKVEALLSNWKDSAKLDAARKKHTEVIDQLKPKEKAKTEESKAIVAKNAPKFSRESTKPNQVAIYRIDGQDFDVKKIKPHGLYVSIPDDTSTFESPHKEVGNTSFSGYATPKNPLNVESISIQHKRGNNYPMETSAGVSALHQLVDKPLFDSLIKADKKELTATIKEQFPDIDTSQYHDAYELLEVLGAQLAIQDGHDAIIQKVEGDPMNEMVILDNAIIDSMSSLKSSTKDGGGLTTAQVRTTLVDHFGEKTVKALKEDKGLIVIHAKISDVPKQFDVKQGDQGFYDPNTGITHLIAENLRPETILPTMLHEMGGHAGFQAMLEPKLYDALMGTFNRLVEAGNPIAIEAQRRAEEAETNKSTQEMEKLPYLLTVAQQELQATNLQKSAITKLIDRIISGVRAFAFEKLGVRLELTPSDMVALAERMIKALASAKATTTNGGDAQLQFSQLSTPQSQINAVRRKYEGTDQWMKAPNGEATKLNELQWLQVRTPNFKAWFGDWENDAKNASKVVDKNGEPMVVYHGSRQAGFTEFDESSDMFFTDRFDVAATYGSYDDVELPSIDAEFYDEHEGVYSAFIVAKNPINADFHGKTWFQSLDGMTADDVVSKAKRLNNDGAIIDNIIDIGRHGFVSDKGDSTVYAVFNSNQIKSATGNTGEFNPTNPDIRFSRASNGQPSPSPTNPKLDRLIHGIGPGEKLYNALSQPIHKWLDAHTSSQWKLVNNMHPAFKQMTREYLRDQKIADDKEKAIIENGIAMSTEEAHLLSDVLEDELAEGITPPAHIVEIAVAIRSELSRQTDEGVRLEQISPESAERYRATYLPRMYNKANKDPVTKTIAKMMDVSSDHQKGRGIFRPVKPEFEAKYTQLGWENRGKWKGLVVMWRDFTKEERINMGEERHALKRFVIGHASMARSLAAGRLLEKIANNDELSSKEPVAGWVLVPNAILKETGGVKRYGKLSGMYVHPDVWENTKHYIEDRDGLMEIYRQTLSVWKQGKTALNLVAHMNNIISSVVMAVAAGLNIIAIKNGYDSLINKDQYYQRIEKLGGMASGHFTGDVRDYFGGDIKEATTPSNLIYRAFKSAWKNKGFEFMRKMYDAEDQLFRMALFRKAVELGATDQEALDYAETFMFNYSDLPAGVKKIRDFGLPFISYTYKAVPAVTRLAFTQPHRVLGLVGMVYGINALAYALLGADADEDKERKNLPDYMQGFSAWGVPKLVRMPWNDGEKATFLDIYRWMPLGDFFAVGNRTGGAELPTWAVMGGPYWSFYNTMIQNRNALTGGDYIGDNDTDRQAFFKRMKFVLSEWVPMYYHVDKNLNAIRNELGDTPASRLLEGMGYTGTDMRGEPAEFKNSLLGATGIKVRKLDMEDQKQRKLISVKSEVLDRKRQINRIRKDQSNPYKERDIAAQVEEIKRLREKAQEIRQQ